MAKPYSLDLRARILKDYDSGVPVEDLVVHYEVSRSWLYSLIRQRRESGSIAPWTLENDDIFGGVTARWFRVRGNVGTVHTNRTTKQKGPVYDVLRYSTSSFFRITKQQL